MDRRAGGLARRSEGALLPKVPEFRRVHFRSSSARETVSERPPKRRSSHALLGTGSPLAWIDALGGSLVRRFTARRPAIAWSLSLLLTFQGLVCVVAVADPIIAGQPGGR